MAVTLLIALALVFFVMRPLLKRVLTPEAPPLALPQSAEIGGPGLGGPGNFGPAPVSSTLPNLSGNGEFAGEEPTSPRVPSWVSNAKSIGEAQVQTLKTVGNLVDENPKQAALIVRDWLSTAT